MHVLISRNTRHLYTKILNNEKELEEISTHYYLAKNDTCCPVLSVMFPFTFYSCWSIWPWIRAPIKWAVSYTRGPEGCITLSEQIVFYQSIQFDKQNGKRTESPKPPHHNLDNRNRLLKCQATLHQKLEMECDQEVPSVFFH